MTSRGRALSTLAGLLSSGARPNVPLPRGSDDWMAVLGLANEHLLGPALHECLTASPWSGLAPPDVVGYLAELRQLNRARNAVLRHQCLEIFDAFTARGIDPILLKGAVALFEPAGSGFETRMMRDIDILVPPHRAGAAAQTLQALGYDILNLAPPGQHTVAEFVRAGTAGAIDLHTELIDAAYVLPASRVRRAAVPVAVGEPRFRIPAPTDRLLHHILHAQLQHKGQYYRGQLRLDQLYDLRNLTARLGTGVDWTEVQAIMAAHHLTAPLQAYLLAAGRLFGSPWPLAERPGPRAGLHCRRTLVQLRFPFLNRLAAPIGNLHVAFAWHRMRAVYGPSGSIASTRLHHARQYFLKKSPAAALMQLFRFE